MASTFSKLIKAVRDGDEVECARVLKLKTADIHKKGIYGRSSIIEASFNDHVNVIELLLFKGADINDKDNDGCSPIIYASNQGHGNVVELLLSKGANINDKDNNGCSPIIHASNQGHVNVIELLLSKGANIIDITNDADTAISLSNGDRIKYILRKWPISMAILILKELAIYYHTDASTLIDLYQYMGREDFTADKEADYVMDENGDNNNDDSDNGNEDADVEEAAAP